MFSMRSAPRLYIEHKRSNHCGICTSNLSHMCYIFRPFHLPLLDQSNYVKLWSSSLCSFLQPPVTSSLFGPEIPLSALFSNTLSLLWVWGYHGDRYRRIIFWDIIMWTSTLKFYQTTRRHIIEVSALHRQFMFSPVWFIASLCFTCRSYQLLNLEMRKEAVVACFKVPCRHPLGGTAVFWPRFEPGTVSFRTRDQGKSKIIHVKAKSSLCLAN
jgi:hypothetical protein